jgi:hypothetical protein
MAQLREAIERLPIDVAPDDPPLSGDLAPNSVKIGYRLAKTAVLEELSEFASGGRAQDPAATRAWISAARGRYSAWIGRIGAK